MEPSPKTALAGQKRAYRLWFEYLRVARQSTDQKVRAALVVSRPVYASWEMEKGESYDAWWRTHAHLFEEKFVVRELKAGEPPLRLFGVIFSQSSPANSDASRPGIPI